MRVLDGDDIAFLSFTKVAANEAERRIKEKMNT